MAIKPSWYLVATNDRMIPPAQRDVRTRWRAAGDTRSHAVYVSQPDAVADLIEQAARQLVSAQTPDRSPTTRTAAAFMPSSKDPRRPGRSPR